MNDVFPIQKKSVIAGLSSAILFLLIVVAAFGLLLYQQSRMATQITELNRVVNRLAKLPTNGVDADLAVTLGRDAIRKGQWVLGQIYLVNAVTNAPRQVRHLNEYAAAVLEKSDIPIDALERLSSVLQLAAYQVDSGDVPAVFALIEKAEQSRKRDPIADSVAVGPKHGLDLPDLWEKLSKVDPNIWKDAVKLTTHVKTLEDFISTLDEQDDPPAELKTKSATELLRWTDVSHMVKQCLYVDACLERLGKKEDIQTDRAVAIVQAAEDALPSFWGMKQSALPRISMRRSATILGELRRLSKRSEMPVPPRF